MTKSDKLRELLSAVEAGTLNAEPYGGMPLLTQFHHTYPIEGWGDGKAMSAYTGNLDAAKALHEAVLPSSNELAVYLHNDDDPVIWHCDFYSDSKTIAHAEHEDPARAWLICILKALIAEAQHDTE